MKKWMKRIIFSAAAIAFIGFVYYKGVYSKVYNQENTKQDLEIGADVENLTMKQIVKDMYNFPDRFAGTKANARAVQYVRNYFREAGLESYYEDSYYHRFYGEYLKCSRYYMLKVDGEVENVIGKISGKDSKRAVVISAHLDSFLGKGVLDNASGVAALLQTAKRLAADFEPGEYAVDIIFAAYNAEESGMLGSDAFYKDLSAHYTELYNINLDCVGAADRALAVKNLEKNSEKLYEDFLPFLDKHGIPYKDSAYAADPDGDPMGSSDHRAFQENGRAAIVLGEADLLGYSNTKKDKDLNVLDYSELDRLADAVEDFVVTTDGKIY